MKVFCDCGVEMFPSEDAQGQPEANLQVAEFSCFGHKRWDIMAVWYVCDDEKCRKSAAFIPGFPWVPGFPQVPEIKVTL